MKYRIIFHIGVKEVSFIPFEEYESDAQCQKYWLDQCAYWKKKNLSWVLMGNSLINLDKVEFITFKKEDN